MDKRLILHLATAGLTSLMVGFLVLLWSYPQLILYLLLIAFAALCYRVIYTVLAARLDLTHLDERIAPRPEPEAQTVDAAHPETETPSKAATVDEIDSDGLNAAARETTVEGPAPTSASHPPPKKTPSRRRPKKARRDLDDEPAGMGELAEG